MFGPYERRVTVAGLCKLVERGCEEAQDGPIGRLSYNKEIIDINQSGRLVTRMVTRSKTKPERFEQVFRAFFC